MNSFDGIAETGRLLTKIYNTLDRQYKITGRFDYDSLEYFACAIFNALFDCNLINLNEKNNNSPFIDLIDYNNSVGVQVTKERPNTKKLQKTTNAFDKYNIKRVIVFFFDLSKASKISSTNGEEIWTIPSIHSYLQSNPAKCGTIIEVLKIWDNPNDLLPSNLVKTINNNTKNQIDKLAKIKKFDFSLFVNDYHDEKKSLYFCGPIYSKTAFDAFKRLFCESSLGMFLSEIDNEEPYSFKRLNANNNLCEISTETLEDRKNRLFNEYSKSELNAQRKDYYQVANRYTEGIFDSIVSTNQAFNSNIMSIVRSAGQGKTIFCCNLVLELIRYNVPCFFITQLLHSGGLYDEFIRQVERINPNGNYFDNLNVITKYLKMHNRTCLVVIDALNEYGNDKDPINGIDNIINDFKCRDFDVRIVISSRNIKYKEFEGHLKAISENVFCVESTHLDNKQVIDRYFSEYGIKIKPNYFLDKLFRQSRLFIKIFCEIYNNRQDADFDNYDVLKLFADYFNIRSKMDVRDRLFEDREEFYDTIKLVVNKMISNNIFNEVSMTEFSLPERKNIKKIADGDIFDITSYPDDSKVKFTFEEYRDYFLLEAYKNKNASEIEQFVSKGNKGMEGFLRNIVLYRRKDESFNKEEDYKYNWYFETFINIVEGIPVQLLDRIDKETILKWINTFDGEKDSNYFPIYKLFFIFVDPNNQDSIFSPVDLCSLSEAGLNNISSCLSMYNAIDKLLDMIGETELEHKYICDLVSLLMLLKVYAKDIKKLKRLILRHYNSEDVRMLSSYGFSEEEILYLEGDDAIHTN